MKFGRRVRVKTNRCASPMESLADRLIADTEFNRVFVFKIPLIEKMKASFVCSAVKTVAFSPYRCYIPRQHFTAQRGFVYLSPHSVEKSQIRAVNSGCDSYGA